MTSQTSSVAFFERIGDALAGKLMRRRLTRPPIGLIVHLLSWEDRIPILDLWSCPANPTASWGKPAEKMAPMSMSLIRIDATASHVPPTLGMEGHPVSGINSNFAVYGCYFPRHGQGVGFGYPLSLGAWLADLMPKLRECPEVSVHLVYSYECDGRSGVAYITFLGRHSAEAKKSKKYTDLNAHLLTMPLPPAWSAEPVPTKKRKAASQGKKATKKARKGLVA
jgi:hypothetical protein